MKKTALVFTVLLSLFLISCGGGSSATTSKKINVKINIDMQENTDPKIRTGSLKTMARTNPAYNTEVFLRYEKSGETNSPVNITSLVISGESVLLTGLELGAEYSFFVEAYASNDAMVCSGTDSATLSGDVDINLTCAPVSTDSMKIYASIEAGSFSTDISDAVEIAGSTVYVSAGSYWIEGLSVNVPQVFVSTYDETMKHRQTMLLGEAIADMYDEDIDGQEYTVYMAEMTHDTAGNIYITGAIYIDGNYISSDFFLIKLKYESGNHSFDWIRKNVMTNLDQIYPAAASPFGSGSAFLFRARKTTGDYIGLFLLTTAADSSQLIEITGLPDTDTIDVSVFPASDGSIVIAAYNTNPNFTLDTYTGMLNIINLETDLDITGSKYTIGAATVQSGLYPAVHMENIVYDGTAAYALMRVGGYFDDGNGYSFATEHYAVIKLDGSTPVTAEYNLDPGSNFGAQNERIHITDANLILLYDYEKTETVNSEQVTTNHLIAAVLNKSDLSYAGGVHYTSDVEIWLMFNRLFGTGTTVTGVGSVCFDYICGIALASFNPLDHTSLSNLESLTGAPLAISSSDYTFTADYTEALAGVSAMSETLTQSELTSDETDEPLFYRMINLIDQFNSAMDA